MLKAPEHECCGGYSVERQYAYGSGLLGETPVGLGVDELALVARLATRFVALLDGGHGVFVRLVVDDDGECTVECVDGSEGSEGDEADVALALEVGAGLAFLVRGDDRSLDLFGARELVDFGLQRTSVVLAHDLFDDLGGAVVRRTEEFLGDEPSLGRDGGELLDEGGTSLLALLLLEFDEVAGLAGSAHAGAATVLAAVLGLGSRLGQVVVGTDGLCLGLLVSHDVSPNCRVRVST